MNYRPSIFIGYRRSDSADAAGRIFDQLEIAFGEDRIFMDVDSIPIGVNFRRHVADIIGKSQFFLLLIGPRWTEAAKGERCRLWDPDDMVRIEIETALAAPEVRVIPVLVSNGAMPPRSLLPPSIHAITDLNAHAIRQNPDFRRDIRKLIDHLGSAPPAAEPAAPTVAVAAPSAPKRVPGAAPPPLAGSKIYVDAGRAAAGKSAAPRAAAADPSAAVPVERSPKIALIGVGGAGGCTVRNAVRAKLGGVDFVVANTDAEGLRKSPDVHRIQLGTKLTQGLGAGSRPEIGRAAAEEAYKAIGEVVQGYDLIVLAAGMGGGTGSGATQVIAKIARECGARVIAFVTTPFAFEGKRRSEAAERAIASLEPSVDALIVVSNQSMFKIAGPDTTFKEAFEIVDDVLIAAIVPFVRSIGAPGANKIEFSDFSKFLGGFGRANIGFASGDTRNIEQLLRKSLDFHLACQPLEAPISKAILHLTCRSSPGPGLAGKVASLMHGEIGAGAGILLSSAIDPTLKDEVSITVWANGRSPSPKQARERVA